MPNRKITTVGELREVIRDMADSDRFSVSIYTSGDEGLIDFENGTEIDTSGVY